MTSVGDIHNWCEMCCEFLNSITVAVIASTDCVVDLLHTLSCRVQKRCTLLMLEAIMKSSKLLNHFFHLLPVLFGFPSASNGSIGRRLNDIVLFSSPI